MMVVLAGVFWINKLLRCSKIVFSVNHLRLIQIVSHATLSGKSCRSKPIHMHSTFQFLVIVDLTSYNMTDSNFWLPETFNQIHAYNWVAQICMQAAIKFYKRGMVTHTLVADALFQTLMLLYNYLVVNICPWRQAITQCFAIWVTVFSQYVFIIAQFLGSVGGSISANFFVLPKHTESGMFEYVVCGGDYFRSDSVRFFFQKK